MKKLLSFLILWTILSSIALAQSYTISGFVSDESSGERLLYASVYDKKSQIGCVTNEYGFFSLNVKNTDVELVASYVGYSPFQKNITLKGDLTININLSPTLTLQEVVVTDKKAEEVVKSSQMSVINMPMQKVKKLPVFMGEADVMKTLQLMPGVQGGQEGASGLYVRGGGPDQNLILLDGVPVYNSDHLFGFFSVFNPDAIASTKLIKGGFPARYGGRLSSVIDIYMKEGNLKEIHGEGSIGTISSKITVQGPIVKDKTGFLISARRTYFDVLMRPFAKLASDKDTKSGYYFYDINAKVHHTFSDKDKLFFSIYNGRDKAYMKDSKSWHEENALREDIGEAKLFWGNFISSLRWNHVFNPRVFANTTVLFSNYQFVVSDKFKSLENSSTVGINNMEFSSGIQDVGAKMDFDFNWFSQHKIKAGVNYLYHTFKPGVSSYTTKNDGSNSSQEIGNSNIYANEYYAYIEDNWTAGRFLTNFGLHYSGLILKNQLYHSLQPRISTRFLFTENISLKAAYARMQQNLHLLTSSTAGLPTDLWMPCTQNIAPQLADQVALGVNWNINNNLELSIEGFYKQMKNIIAYKQGASFFDISNNWEDKLEVGDGLSYGGEFLLRRNYGKFTGWLGYTLSWSWRKFENLNFGKPYPDKYDRRHDVSLALTYNLNKNIDFGASWVYGTGSAITLALAEYKPFDESISQEHTNIEYYDSKNAYRMPSYHRLDVSANFRKDTKWGQRTWSVGIYNAYNRKNPFYLYFEADEDNRNNKQLTQISLFPMIPFVRFSFTF